ncbi:MAG: hypothetical protein MZU97_22615 [Bacillus subtilis]|nr:hypothetical protein [Bacillus subtilis]
MIQKDIVRSQTPQVRHRRRHRRRRTRRRAGADGLRFRSFRRCSTRCSKRNRKTAFQCQSRAASRSTT